MSSINNDNNRNNLNIKRTNSVKRNNNEEKQINNDHSVANDHNKNNENTNEHNIKDKLNHPLENTARAQVKTSNKVSSSKDNYNNDMIFYKNNHDKIEKFDVSFGMLFAQETLKNPFNAYPRACELYCALIGEVV